MASLASVLQMSTLFVLVFAVYYAYGQRELDGVKRYSYEDNSPEHDDWIYTIGNTGPPNFKPTSVIASLPQFKPPYAGRPSDAIIAALGQKPPKNPVTIGTTSAPVVEGPAKPLPPLPSVSPYPSPSPASYPPPAPESYPPPAPASYPSPAPSSYASPAPSSYASPTPTPYPSPSPTPSPSASPSPSPTPSPSASPSTSLSSSPSPSPSLSPTPTPTITPSLPPPPPPAAYPSPSLSQSPSPAPTPYICGRKQNCYQWFTDELQLSIDGYQLCDARDEIRASKYCCIR